MEQTYRVVIEGERPDRLILAIMERDDLEYDRVAAEPMETSTGTDFHLALTKALRAVGRRLTRLDPVFMDRYFATREFIAHTVELGAPDNCPTCGFPKKGVPLYTDEQPPESEEQNLSLIDRHMTP
jgi:hypothetical protein